jgi:hypothetical protein
MTLLDAKAPKPRSLFLKLLPLIIFVAFVLSAILAYRLRDYPEERAVSRFLTSLEDGNYQRGYQLWQAVQSYSFNDFMRDWGPQGDYGKIRTFTILHSRSKGSNNVIVTVRINNTDPPLEILVDRNTKGLAFSPF